MTRRIRTWTIFLLAFWAVYGSILLSTNSEAAIRREDLNPEHEKMYQKLGGELMCQCGCLSPIGSCPHPQCGFGVPFKEDIFQKIVDGNSRQEILDHFIQDYGLKILAAPPKTGFNLVAGWSFPFIVIGSIGTIVVFFIRRWVSTTAEEATKKSVSGGPTPKGDKYRSQLQKELDEFEP